MQRLTLLSKIRKAWFRFTTRLRARWIRFYTRRLLSPKKEIGLTQKYGCGGGAKVVKINSVAYGLKPTYTFYLKHRRTGSVIVDKADSIKTILLKYGDQYEIKQPAIKTAGQEF